MKRLLLVEDYEEKARDILTFIEAKFPGVFLVERSSSYNGAQEQIFEHPDVYDLILLDMAMSTYDLSKDNSGGPPESTAGQDILEGMFLRGIETPVIVVTMYNVFGRKELDAFHQELKDLYPQNYKSYVFYSAQRKDWMRDLYDQIKQTLSL